MRSGESDEARDDGRKGRPAGGSARRATRGDRQRRDREAQRLERLADRNDNYTADFKEGVRRCALMIRVGPTTTPLDDALGKVKP